MVAGRIGKSDAKDVKEAPKQGEHSKTPPDLFQNLMNNVGNAYKAQEKALRDAAKQMGLPDLHLTDSHAGKTQAKAKSDVHTPKAKAPSGDGHPTKDTQAKAHDKHPAQQKDLGQQAAEGFSKLAENVFGKQNVQRATESVQKLQKDVQHTTEAGIAAAKDAVQHQIHQAQELANKTGDVAQQAARAYIKQEMQKANNIAEFAGGAGEQLMHHGKSMVGMVYQEAGHNKDYDFAFKTTQKYVGDSVGGKAVSYTAAGLDQLGRSLGNAAMGLEKLGFEYVALPTAKAIGDANQNIHKYGIAKGAAETVKDGANWSVKEAEKFTNWLSHLTPKEAGKVSLDVAMLGAGAVGMVGKFGAAAEAGTVAAGVTEAGTLATGAAEIGAVTTRIAEAGGAATKVAEVGTATTEAAEGVSLAGLKQSLAHAEHAREAAEKAEKLAQIKEGVEVAKEVGEHTHHASALADKGRGGGHGPHGGGHGGGEHGEATEVASANKPHETLDT